MSHDHKYALGVVGSGHIAGIIVNRLIASGYLSAERIAISYSKKLDAHPIAGVSVCDNAEVVKDSRLVMIAVTPQRFAEAARTILPAVTADHVIVSVMAGVSTRRVAEELGGGLVRVVRAMPNLPFGLGCGVTGLFRGEHASADDMEESRHLFNAGGVTVEVEREELMDAVTAVAGSGPAYFYYFVEMMMAGGVAAGLRPEDAQVLAAHACVGAGGMLLEKGASPSELRAAVTSPGGTTQAAMKKLEASGVAEHVREAVMAAFRRGQELGQLLANSGNS